MRRSRPISRHRHGFQPVGFGDVAFIVDGEPVDFTEHYAAS